MNTLIHLLPLRRKRDVVVARHRARQIARLLGFDAREQACIAAGVFVIARTAWQHTGRRALAFELAGDVFQVVPVLGPRPDADLGGLLNRLPLPAKDLLRLEKTLPPDRPAVDRADLAWVVEELARRTPLDVFEELERQNQELLVALLDLHSAHADRAPATGRPRAGAA
jgi:hypothetical protein